MTSGYATAHYLERRSEAEGRPGDRGGRSARGDPRRRHRVRDADALPGFDPPPDAAADGVTRARCGGTSSRFDCRRPRHRRRRASTFTDLREARGKRSPAILAGAAFVCSNRDRAYPVEGAPAGRWNDRRGDRGRDGRKALCHRQARAVPLRGGDPAGGEEGPCRRDRGLERLRHGRGASRRRHGCAHHHGSHREGRAGEGLGDAVPDRVIGSLEELFALPEFAGI